MNISKINCATPFTSNVNIVYGKNNEYLAKKYFKNPNFKEAIKTLEQNGDDNNVTFYPHGILSLGMQIEQNINGKKYITNNIISHSPKMIPEHYEIALAELEPKPKSFA